MRLLTRGLCGLRSLTAKKSGPWLALFVVVAVAAVPAHASIIAPDNGSGTVALPPETYLGGFAIIDGLPAGTSISLIAKLHPVGARRPSAARSAGTRRTGARPSSISNCPVPGPSRDSRDQSR